MKLRVFRAARAFHLLDQSGMRAYMNRITVKLPEDLDARLRHDRDLPLGTADASVVAAAERLGVPEVATLDRRHFTVARPSTGPFTLLP